MRAWISKRLDFFRKWQAVDDEASNEGNEDESLEEFRA